MRYKYVKITNATLCDEVIEDASIQEELIDKVIKARINCSVSFLQNGIENSHKKVKVDKLEDGKVFLLVQSKNSSFKMDIKLEDLVYLEINSYEDAISIDNESNRYDFINC